MVVIAQEPAAARPNTYTVKRGDTLWDLAKQFLNDAYLWPQIYRLNTSLIRDPHWIYPGEVLTMPRAMAAAPGAPAAPAASVASEPAEDFSAPTIFAPHARKAIESNIDTRPLVEPAPVVRLGEYLAAPYVAQEDGPRGAGKIIGSAELEGIASAADPGRYQAYSSIYVATPAGVPVAAGDRFVAVRRGPALEGLGQVIVPTAVIRVTRAPGRGEAAVAQVVQVFNEVRPGQELLPYDSSALQLKGQPAPVQGGRVASVKWISSEPVLPSVQSYLVLNLSAKDGVKVGDRFELFRPRVAAAEPGDLALPEVPIAMASAVRVTPFATTVILTSQEQPKIEPGTKARLSAHMP